MENLRAIVGRGAVVAAAQLEFTLRSFPEMEEKRHTCEESKMRGTVCVEGAVGILIPSSLARTMLDPKFVLISHVHS